MIFWITVKKKKINKIIEKRLKRLNARLKHYMARPHALPHQVFASFYEMGSSYTWCNLTKVTPFVDRRFVIDLTVKKNSIKCYRLTYSLN